MTTDTATETTTIVHARLDAFAETHPGAHEFTEGPIQGVRLRVATSAAQALWSLEDGYTDLYDLNSGAWWRVTVQPPTAATPYVAYPLPESEAPTEADQLAVHVANVMAENIGAPLDPYGVLAGVPTPDPVTTFLAAHRAHLAARDDAPVTLTADDLADAAEFTSTVPATAVPEPTKFRLMGRLHPQDADVPDGTETVAHLVGHQTITSVVIAPDPDSAATIAGFADDDAFDVRGVIDTCTGARWQVRRFVSEDTTQWVMTPRDAGSFPAETLDCPEEPTAAEPTAAAADPVPGTGPWHVHMAHQLLYTGRNSDLARASLHTELAALAFNVACNLPDFEPCDETAAWADAFGIE